MAHIERTAKGVFNPYSLIIETSGEHSALSALFSEDDATLKKLEIHLASPAAEGYRDLCRVINKHNTHA